jgi:hypothetical protein
MKRFSDQPETAKRVDFELSFWKGGKEYPLHFHAYPSVDAIMVAEVNKSAASGDQGAISALLMIKNAIRTMLDDNDGTPLDWKPEPLPSEVRVPDSEVTGWPTEEPEPQSADEETEPEQQFLAPDGIVHPMRDAAKLAEFDAGSSRRRWVDRVDGDNDYTVPAKSLMKVWRWLIGEAANRPTVR